MNRASNSLLLLQLPPRLVGWASDLLLWGLVVFLFYNLGDRFTDWMELPFLLPGQRIELYFNDVSQLSAGSPVKWMGVDVGYVAQVKPEKGRVKVIANIKAGTVFIPHGSRFTVEFNGLAGSKSLEASPALATQHQFVGEDIYGYDIIEPIRIQDVMNTQMTVADAMEDSMHNIEDSIEKLEQTVQLEAELANVSQWMSDINGWMTFMDNGITRLDSQLSQDVAVIQSTLKDVEQVFDHAQQSFSGLTLPQTQDRLALFNKALLEAEKAIEMMKTHQELTQVNAFIESLETVSLVLGPEAMARFEAFYESLSRVNPSLLKLRNKSQGWAPDAVPRWIEQSQQWVDKSKTLDF